MKMTDGDRLFQRYLRERDLQGAEDHEPELGESTSPDFLIKHAGGEALFEVKSIGRSPLQVKLDFFGPAHPAFTMGPAEHSKPIRSAIKTASRQLKPHQQPRRALVVVVANPDGLAVLPSDEIVIGAMYGDATYVSPTTSDGPASAGRWVHLRNGKLTNDHPYISGVVLIDAGVDGALVVSAYETIAAACIGTAERLPLHIFDGPHDRRYTWEPADHRALIVSLPTRA